MGPTPDYLYAIGPTHQKREVGNWRIFTIRHQPKDCLRGHLTFALKHEGLDLGVLKALYLAIDAEQIVDLIRAEPTGAYSRRLWFLYECLTGKDLKIENAARGNYVDLVNEKFQYPGPSRNSRRHRVRNNLPGTPQFCPLIRKTKKLEKFISQDISRAAVDHLGETRPELLSRAAAFLLLEDSIASYRIEGETPAHSRIERWGRIIGEAGQRELSVNEFEYLRASSSPTIASWLRAAAAKRALLVNMIGARRRPCPSTSLLEPRILKTSSRASSTPTSCLRTVSMTPYSKRRS